MFNLLLLDIRIVLLVSLLWLPQQLHLRWVRAMHQQTRHSLNHGEVLWMARLGIFTFGILRLMSPSMRGHPQAQLPSQSFLQCPALLSRFNNHLKGRNVVVVLISVIGMIEMALVGQTTLDPGTIRYLCLTLFVLYLMCLYLVADMTYATEFFDM